MPPQLFFLPKEAYALAAEQQGDEHERQQQGDEQQGDKQQSNKQQELERQSDCKQRLTRLSLSWEALKRKNSEAIDCIAEETSAKDRTGWFKRTQWDKHLQAYSDWKLLAYAIRSPRDDEPELQQVAAAVEQLVEQAVQGLSTLSIDTLRWLRSAEAKEPNVRPLGRMQNKESQQRAARLWARLLCYCIRLVAAEE
ncbi:hypothetical protein EK21DRAFT_118223 [Setomelanomma holmii]|uniref:Uncharacterized protein n=1 Tax=Setomelanomma holmii TaxID=210430 RepID=A0A9P4GYI0_9PLEO|nr:hypothetical protein EK21DRAFT_118223 [Setomelanomma holmii]